MRDTKSQKFLDYYMQELSYLKNEGQRFAKTYPKIAKRLDLSDKESKDPHTERLIESFAFLTARINQSVDEKFLEQAYGLLEVLYPHLLTSLPSMTIAHFRSNNHNLKKNVGYSIPPHTQLITKSEIDLNCKFQTVYPVQILPIDIFNITTIKKLLDTEEKWYLKISLKSPIQKIADLNINHLRFFINMDPNNKMALYASIFGAQKNQIFISRPNENNDCDMTILPLPKNSLLEVGFKADETALPLSEHGSNMYALLQEYFHFPDKFMFFDIGNLETPKIKDFLNSNLIDIWVPLQNPQNFINKNFNPEKDLLLGCTPIINIFKKTSEPIKIDYKKPYYRLIPDQRRERTTEILSIKQVFIITKNSEKPIKISPYFSLNHHQKTNNFFWHHKRVPTIIPEIDGTDTLVSITNQEFDPMIDEEIILYADTLCTNRYLPSQMGANTTMQIEEKIPMLNITCLDKPTEQINPPANGNTLWMLISQLAVNYFGISSQNPRHDNSLEKFEILKELLYIYSFQHTGKNFPELDELSSLTLTPIVRRIGAEYWRGFVKGFEIVIGFQNSLGNIDKKIFLLGNIMRHYFTFFTDINSFLEFAIKDLNNNQEVARWQPIQNPQHPSK